MYKEPTNKSARRDGLCVALAMLCTVAFVGCRSFSSTLLHRDESNSCWTRQKHLKGVPVTLEVPTHLRVDVVEKTYLVKRNDTVEMLPVPSPIREVRKDFIKTKKIFTVDLKRPAVGTIKANIDLDPDKQYFDEIKTNVTDETIDEVSTLIAQIAPQGLFGRPTTTGSDFDSDIKEIESVVSSRIFEIDSPDFEDSLRDYLENHLNGCHDCGSDIGVCNSPGWVAEASSTTGSKTISKR